MQLPGTYGVFMAPLAATQRELSGSAGGARDAHAHAPLVRRRFSVDLSFDIKALGLPGRAPTVGNGGDPIETSAWWCRAVIWSVIRYRRHSDERSKSVGRTSAAHAVRSAAPEYGCLGPRCPSVPTLVGHGGSDGRPRAAQ